VTVFSGKTSPLIWGHSLRNRFPIYRLNPGEIKFFGQLILEKNPHFLRSSRTWASRRCRILHEIAIEIRRGIPELDGKLSEPA
jgi:hypothetical protein